MRGDRDSSERIGDDSSLVEDTDSGECDNRALPARDPDIESPRRPRMRAGAAVASNPGIESPPSSGAMPPGLAESRPPPSGRTAPLLIVRTYSVREGRKATYRVQSTTLVRAVDADATVVPPLERGLSVQDVVRRRAADRKSLRVQVAKLVGAYPEVCVDLSYHWSDTDQTSGARTALAAGLLAGSRRKKLSIDLSNQRIKDLREGAQMRCHQNLSAKKWRKSIIDSEAAALAEALCKELARVCREQILMPEFGLICHDQPLADVVYPLTKALANGAAVLTGLKRLDLSRYSRSSEIPAARPDAAEAADAMERYVIRLAMLLASTHSLRELCLRMNGLSALDLATLMVADNKTLAKLDLSCNPICELPDGVRSMKGMRELVRHLHRYQELVELDLSFCGLDEKAADLLLKGLDGHPGLEKINLTGNHILMNHAVFKDARVHASGTGIAPRQHGLASHSQIPADRRRQTL
jgi:hypothetical protein